jgi:hypothetical protein
MNTTKRPKKTEPGTLATAAEAIGTKLGELAVSMGFAKPAPKRKRPAAKKKPISKPAKGRKLASTAKARAKMGK